MMISKIRNGTADMKDMTEYTGILCPGKENTEYGFNIYL